ncbi:unnamed protein product [Arabidopsis lyrata]|nr:unnamed protein product [Arabidopsis lyrata]
METIILHEVSKDMPATCCICFDHDLEAEQMFSVYLCRHQFCVECVKRYIEVKLLEGGVLRCPHYQCESKLTLRSCDNILTHKQRDMWERRNREESVPVTDRVYCPNPRCSALMSKAELSKSIKEAGVKRRCVKCSQPFCMNCKVLWHNNLLCDDYMRWHLTEDDMMLKNLANHNMWRQCVNCQQMIERSEGCIHVTCWCGYSFCYTCGEEWKHGAMWEQRIEEESVPVTERFYCPNPRCSALMSKTKLSKFIEEDGSMRCFQCGERFCMNCKVLWHSSLSCDDYKVLGNNPTSDDKMLKVLANENLWRQYVDIRFATHVELNGSMEVALIDKGCL